MCKFTWKELILYIIIISVRVAENFKLYTEFQTKKKHKYKNMFLKNKWNITHEM